MKKGFTLSEILITLGIIGVVSAVTIPSVIQHFQKQKTVSQLKKVYTVLNQAIKLSQIDNDEYKNWDLTSLSNKKFFEKYWKPYLKTLKYCNSYKDCGYKTNNAWIQPNGSKYDFYVTAGIPILLSDGIFIEFLTSNGLIFVDLNSGEKPNQLGKDLFLLQINSNGNIRTHGENYSYNDIKFYCNSVRGHTCAARIRYNNWQIDKDYPW